jgi:hypothetical protein
VWAIVGGIGTTEPASIFSIPTIAAALHVMGRENDRRAAMPIEFAAQQTYSPQQLLLYSIK